MTQNKGKAPAVQAGATKLEPGNGGLRAPSLPEPRTCPKTGHRVVFGPTLDEMSREAQHIALTWLYIGRDAQKREATL